MLDAFDMDASQVRYKPIETLLITCPASSPTPDPAMEPFPSRNVGQIRDLITIVLQTSVDWRVMARKATLLSGTLMAVTAVSFAMASIIHAGTEIPLGVTTVSDPFPGAVIPEAVIAVVVAAGAVAVFTRRPAAREAALMVTLFALLGTAYGLTVTLGSARTGDIAYHVGILAVLVVTLGLLLMPGRKRARRATA